MSKMTWEQFLVELDKMNPLERKEYWYFRKFDDRIIFEENGIFWNFWKNGKIIIYDEIKDTVILLGNYDFEDILKKIEVWFK